MPRPRRQALAIFRVTGDREAWALNGLGEAAHAAGQHADVRGLPWHPAPHWKPRGGELSVGNKANNKMVSSLRSAVERCIAHLKGW